MVRALYHLPKLLLILAVVVLLVAVSDPFLTATEEVRGDVESRVRVDLVDTSLSMAWEFPDTGKSRAEVARDAHLQFLEMRREKNDRVSLWLFSSYPYMVDDFILDDEIYYFQVFEAPYVTVRLLAPQFRSTRDQIYVPPDKVRIIPTEGTTNLIRALRSIVRHFDSDEASAGGAANQHRAVLIITDADVDEVPFAELADLNRRNIVPYMIYINIGDADRTRIAAPETPPLVETIREYGGRLLRRHRSGQPDPGLRGHRRARGGARRADAPGHQDAHLLPLPARQPGAARGRDSGRLPGRAAVGHASLTTRRVGARAASW